MRLHKNGTEIQVSIAASPVRDAEGEVRGVATVMRDIGGLKAAMAALERKTSLSQMLAAAAAQAGSAAGRQSSLRCGAQQNRTHRFRPYLPKRADYLAPKHKLLRARHRLLRKSGCHCRHIDRS